MSGDDKWKRYTTAFRKRLGGARAVTAHHAVIDALQHFASVTDCLAGQDVIEWFRSESAAAQSAGRQALAATPGASPGGEKP